MGAQLLCPLCQEEEEEQSQAAVIPVPLGALGETCCEEHGEKIYFFCETDAELLCVFCREGPAHQAHTVGFLDEAIQPYRTQIESKKQQVEATFERLNQELGEQRHLLMTRLVGLEQQIWKERDEYITKVSQEVQRLGAQVEELEEKCQQPASELLQDVRLNQSRYETKTFVSPEAISSDLAKKIRNLHRKILGLPKMMRTFSAGQHPPVLNRGTQLSFTV
ncbi:Tripartite motif-containing protein 15 [Lemmus lemmus]